MPNEPASSHTSGSGDDRVWTKAERSFVRSKLSELTAEKLRVLAAAVGIMLTVASDDMLLDEFMLRIDASKADAVLEQYAIAAHAYRAESEAD